MLFKSLIWTSVEKFPGVVFFHWFGIFYFFRNTDLFIMLWNLIIFFAYILGLSRYLHCLTRTQQEKLWISVLVSFGDSGFYFTNFCSAAWPSDLRLQTVRKRSFMYTLNFIRSWILFLAVLSPWIKTTHFGGWTV